MTKKSVKIIAGIICLVIWALFYAVKFGGFLDGSLSEPLAQVLAFIAILIFCFTFTRGISAKGLTVILFIFLLMTKFEAVSFPPYGDAIGGPFAEAMWLDAHNFNYHKFLYEPDYAQGGQRVYFFTIFSAYVALIMKIFQKPLVVNAVLHLLNFVMISATASLLFLMAKKIFSERVALLTSLLFLSFPLVQSTSELLIMEVPCLLFTMMAAYFLSEGKDGKAVFAAIGAVLVKGSGVIACGAVGGILSIKWVYQIFAKQKFSWKLFFYILIAFAIAGLKILSKYFIGDAHISSGLVHFLSGLKLVEGLTAVRWFFIVMVLFFLRLLFRRDFEKKHLAIIGIVILFGLSFSAVLINFSVNIPRYRLVFYPFVTMMTVYAIVVIARYRILQRLLLIVSILTSAYASYGCFYPVASQDHFTLERSLEYRHDQAVDRAMIDYIQKNYADYTIVAPLLLAQALAIKKLGYVDEDLKVFIYGYPCHYGGIHNYPGLKQLKRDQTIFIAKTFPSGKVGKISNIYPLDIEKDKVIKEFHSGRQKAALFMGGYGIEACSLMVKYLNAKNRK